MLLFSLSGRSLNQDVMINRHTVNRSQNLDAMIYMVNSSCNQDVMIFRDMVSRSRKLDIMIYREMVNSQVIQM